MTIKKFFEYIIKGFLDGLRPFPKGIKLPQAVWWWFVGHFFIYTKKKKWRRFCSECGWPLIRIDDLYDPPMESIHPDAIQMCQFCGTQFEVTIIRGVWFSDRFIFPVWDRR